MVQRRIELDPLRQLTKFPLLTHEEEIQLAHDMKRGGAIAKRARERMIKSNTRLVVAIAKKHARQCSHLTLFDLVQEGCVGLQTAVEKYDPTRGTRFSTHAYWWIRQSITRAIAEQDQTIHIPVGQMERFKQIKRFAGNFSQQHARNPSIKEIAIGMDLEEKKIHRLFKAWRPRSLDFRIGDDETTTLLDFVAATNLDPNADPSDALDRLDVQQQIEKAIDLLPQLSDVQRRAIVMHLGLDGRKPMSFAEMAKELSMSRNGAQLAYKRGISKLQELLGRNSAIPIDELSPIGYIKDIQTPSVPGGVTT